MCLITVVLHCRSHRRVDDTPRFTPTHKYNVWEDDRRSTGATPRFSKGKSKNLTGILHHFTYRKFSKMMKLCMLCSMPQLSVGIKCKIIFGLITDCHLQYIRDRPPERQFAQSQSPVGKVRVFYDGLYSGPRPIVRRPISAYPRVNFNPGFFFLCSKAFSRKIFSVIFRTSNHQLVDKKN